jgi:hypothetical protein
LDGASIVTAKGDFWAKMVKESGVDFKHHTAKEVVRELIDHIDPMDIDEIMSSYEVVEEYGLLEPWGIKVSFCAGLPMITSFRQNEIMLSDILNSEL